MRQARSFDRANRECLRGPYNPSINDECGLLVEGFEHPPCLGLVWNPEYHKALVEQLGFRLVCRSYGLHLPLHRLDVPERLKRVVERVVKRATIKLRPINMSSLEEELKIVREIYNSTLDRNWGFMPDLDGRIAGYRGRYEGVCRPGDDSLLPRLMERTPAWP